uniref:KY-like immunoglobulin-like domain-containing protein n=1 Tax=Arion vulgaris TaxID=1028688 RepID=A0A0B6Z095_9EUPU
MAEEKVQLPKITAGLIGPQAKFLSYGLSLVSHGDPVVYMQQDQPEVEIILGTEPGTRIMVKLVSHERKKECTEYCLIRCMGDKFLFLIRPPLPGFYKFQIYALLKDEAGPQMLNVYNYLIHCPGSFEDKPFPKQYPLWKNGCYLEEPINLPKGIKDPMVRYKVFIPNANDVQVKVGEEWNPLQQTDPGMFEGLVDFSTSYAPGSKAKLNVKFVGNNYNTLLEYSL